MYIKTTNWALMLAMQLKKIYRLKILQRQITEKFTKKLSAMRMADRGQLRWYLLHTMLNYFQNCGILLGIFK